MFDPSGMDPKMYPKGFNRSLNSKRRAKRYTRTERTPRYYLIDFSLSRRYPSRDALGEPLGGGEMSAPEHRRGGRCNPFCTDIFYLGNLVREHFMLVRLDLFPLFKRLTGSYRSIMAPSS
jgi:hypothetical protein